MATLSVSSSTKGSFSSTRSPICRSQARTTALVPSCSWGTTTSIMTAWYPGLRRGDEGTPSSNPNQLVDLRPDARHRGHRPVEQDRIMRAWNVGHGEARHRRVEIDERLVGDDRRDLGAETAGTKVL